MSNTTTPPVEHPKFAALRVVNAGLDDLADANCWSLSGGDVSEFLAEIAVAEARLAAAKLAAVAEADARNLGVSEATSTAAWLRGRLLLRPGEAKRTVRLAQALRDDCATTGSALGQGMLSAEHASVIVHALTHLPPGVDPPTRARAERFLVEQSASLDPLLLRRAAEALAETLTTKPDRDEQILRDIARREFTAVPACDGMIRVTGWLDREAWAEIGAVLDPLAAPAPAADGTSDPRSPARRRADGLLEMARIAATATMPQNGGLRPAMTVGINLDYLTGRLAGMGRLNTGDQISAAAARRLACDAHVIPVVLGSASQPLDIGRATRIVPPSMRRALVGRDDACAFPGCDRQAAWAEAHHIVHWSDGGDTALSNLVLLCLEHHNAVHHHGWSVALEGDGLPTFRPPPWIDPTGEARRHHRYRLRQLSYDINDHDPPD